MNTLRDKQVRSRFIQGASLALCLAASVGCGGGGGGGGGSEGGGVLLFSDSFASCSVSPGWGEALISDSRNYPERSGETLFVHLPQLGGVCAGNYRALAGTNERTPWQIGMGAAALHSYFGSLPEEAYVEWREFFTESYPFASSSQKLARWGYESSEHPESRKQVSFVTQARNSDLNVQFFCGLGGDDSRCHVDNAIHSNRGVPLNRWVKLALWVKLNSPGAENGFIRVYLDDALLVEGTGLNLRGDDDRGFDFFWLGGNYSMLSGELASTGSRYIADFAMYSSFPG